MLVFLVIMFYSLGIFSWNTANCTSCRGKVDTEIVRADCMRVTGLETCTAFNLTCMEEDCSEGTLTWFFSNSTTTPQRLLKISSNIFSAAGSLTLFSGSQTLQIGPSTTYARVQLGGNYTCACSSSASASDAASSDSSSHVYILVFQQEDVNRPTVYTAKIGEPFALASRLVFGSNRYALSHLVSWSRNPCMALNNRLYRQRHNYTDLFFLNVTESDGPDVYSQTINRADQEELCTESPLKGATKKQSLLFYFPFSKESHVTLIPYKVPIIEVMYPKGTGSDRRRRESNSNEMRILLLRFNGELLPRSRKSVTFKLSIYPTNLNSITSTKLSVSVNQSYYQNYSTVTNTRTVDLTDNPANKKFPSTITVTCSATLNITSGTVQRLLNTLAPPRMNKAVEKSASQTVKFRIFEMSSLQFIVTFEVLCSNELVRATPNTTVSIPQEYSYKIEFFTVLPSGLEHLDPAPENDSPSKRYLLDMKGRLQAAKVVMMTRLVFTNLGPDRVLGPQHEERLYTPCTETALLDTTPSPTTIATPVTITIISCLSAVIIAVISLVSVSVVMLVRRRSCGSGQNVGLPSSSVSGRPSRAVVMNASSSNCDICTSSCVSNATDISSLPGSSLLESATWEEAELQNSQNENYSMEGRRTIPPTELLYSPHPPDIEDPCFPLNHSLPSHRRASRSHCRSSSQLPSHRARMSQAPCGHKDCLTSRRRERSTQSMPYELVEGSTARRQRRQRSFSTSQIDENFSRRRLQRLCSQSVPPPPRAALVHQTALSEEDEAEREGLTGDFENESSTYIHMQPGATAATTTTAVIVEGDNDSSLTTTTAAAVVPVASTGAGLQVPGQRRGGGSHSRNSSEERPPSSLTTCSVRSNACLLHHSQEESSLQS